MERKQVSFSAQIQPGEVVNSEFTRCKCYVMAVGKNRNLSHISKESVDRALPTIYNIPVVGHMFETENGLRMGGHDATWLWDEEGKLKYQPLTVPFGVVPVSDMMHYETVVNKFGKEEEYLVGDVVLWTGRYPEIKDAIYSDDVWFGQSMEINVEDNAPLDEDMNYTDIKSFEFSALCLLGKSDNPEEHVEPCFPESRVEPYSLDDRFATMFSELKSELAKTLSEDNMDNNTLDNNLGCPCGDPGCECPAPGEEPKQQGEDPANPPAEKPYEYETLLSLLEAACGCGDVEEKDEAGEAYKCRRAVCDYDEYHVYVITSTYGACGGCRGKKYQSAKYEYDAAANTVAIGEFSDVVLQWTTAEEIASNQELNAEYQMLCAYKREREDSDRKANIDAVLSEFGDLSGNQEFIDLLEKKYEYTDANAFRVACYVIRGKQGAVHAKTPRTPEVPVGGAPAVETSARDRLHETYGKI